MKLLVNYGNVSRMLGNLENKGLIGRDVDKENRRNTYVYLTRQGEEEHEFSIKEGVEKKYV